MRQGGLPVGGLFYLKRIYIDGSLNSRVFGRERRMILMKNPPTIAPNIYTHPFAMCWGNIQWQHPQTTSNYKWIMGTLLRDLFLASLIQWKSLSANKLLQKSKRKLGKCDCRCLWSVLVSFFWISLRPHVSHPKEWFTGMVAGLAWIECYFFVVSSGEIVFLLSHILPGMHLCLSINWKRIYSHWGAAIFNPEQLVLSSERPQWSPPVLVFLWGGGYFLL